MATKMTILPGGMFVRVEEEGYAPVMINRLHITSIEGDEAETNVYMTGRSDPIEFSDTPVEDFIRGITS